MGRRRLLQELLRESENFHFKYFSTTNKKLSPKPLKPFKSTSEADGKKAKKKVLTTPKILLYDLNGKITSVSFEEAKKIADRNHLNLVEVESTGKKSVYKLAEGTKARKSTDKEKNKMHLFSINSSISNHDLQTKLKQAMKLLNKQQNIQIEILDAKNNGKTEEIAAEIKKEFESVHKIESEISDRKRYVFSIVSLAEKKIQKNCSEEKNHFEEN